MFRFTRPQPEGQVQFIRELHLGIQEKATSNEKVSTVFCFDSCVRICLRESQGAGWLVHGSILTLLRCLLSEVMVSLLIPRLPRDELSPGEWFLLSDGLHLEQKAGLHRSLGVSAARNLKTGCTSQGHEAKDVFLNDVDFKFFPLVFSEG